MDPVAVRNRLGMAFDALLQCHNRCAEEASSALLLDATAVKARAAALTRDLAMAQRQALLSIMESQAAILGALIAAQGGDAVKRAGADRPNGGTKPS